MTQMSTEALPVLDVSVIEAMRSLGETDVFAEIANMFLEDVPPDLSALSAAIAGGRVGSVAQIAHSLRGNALGVGALRMVPVCAAIEYAARAGSLEEAAASARRLELEFAATREALQVLIQ
jgi:HPt (histidine-containing phosphotransfer) domain-containing protein